MDTITHMLFGIFIAALIAGKLGFKNLKWPVAAGVIAALAPDIDIITLLFSPGMFYEYHRVATHSIIGAFLIAVIIAILFSRLKKSFINYLPITLLAVASHLYLDFITSTGIQLFYPYSTARVALNMVPFVDVYLLAVLAAGIIFIRLYPAIGAKISALILIICIAAIGARIGLGVIADAKVNNINDDSYISPHLFNPFKWAVVNEQPNSYILSDYNLLTGMKTSASIPKLNDPMVEASKEAKIVKTFISSSTFPFAVIKGDTVIWHDLRVSFDGSRGFTASVLLDSNLAIIQERMGL
ncbi:MAG: metal-dependent hydrolase [Nanoarchaeota archaeon]|nr:metal-dependent hydrolase [Nanoarchaeota archaeon]